MDKLIMAFEQSTDEMRCLLFDRYGQPAARAVRPLRLLTPRPGFAEWDAKGLFTAMVASGREAMRQAAVTHNEIEAIALAVAKGGMVVWAPASAEPVYNAISGDCKRTAPLCGTLRRENLQDMVHARCGLYIDTYAAALKACWILDNVQGTRERAQAGELSLGSMDCWLLWNLTGGKLHQCDYTNAGWSMLYSPAALQWDAELCARLGISASMLPEVRSTSHVYGQTDPSVFGGPIPIACIGAAEHTALFGQLCYDMGTVRIGCGDEAEFIFHTGKTHIQPRQRLITTFAYGIKDIIKYTLISPQRWPLAGDSGGQSMLRGAQEALRAATEETGVSPEIIKVDGPRAEDDAFLQRMADTLGLPVQRPRCRDVAALGAAYIAGVTTRYWDGRTDIVPYWKEDRTFTPA